MGARKQLLPYEAWATLVRSGNRGRNVYVPRNPHGWPIDAWRQLASRGLLGRKVYVSKKLLDGDLRIRVARLRTDGLSLRRIAQLVTLETDKALSAMAVSRLLRQDRNRPKVVPLSDETVRRIYDLTDQGISLRKIASILSAELDEPINHMMVSRRLKLVRGQALRQTGVDAGRAEPADGMTHSHSDKIPRVGVRRCPKTQGG